MLKIPVIFDRYNRKKDRSYSLTFVSSLEIAKEQREAIDEMWMTEGWLLFAPNADEIQIPAEEAKTGLRKPTDVLTARMYVAWNYRKEKGKTSLPFNEFVRSQLDGIGQQYLDEVK